MCVCRARLLRPPSRPPRLPPRPRSAARSAGPLRAGPLRAGPFRAGPLIGALLIGSRLRASRLTASRLTASRLTGALLTASRPCSPPPRVVCEGTEGFGAPPGKAEALGATSATSGSCPGLVLARPCASSVPSPGKSSTHAAKVALCQALGTAIVVSCASWVLFGLF